MKTYEEMAENVFRRRDEYITKKKETRKKTVKLSLSVACMAVVLFAGLGLWQRGQIDVSPEKEKNTKVTEQTLNDAVYPGIKDYYGPGEDEQTQVNNDEFLLIDEAPRYNGKLLVSYYETAGASACYALPKNGKAYFSIPLNGAIEEYNDEVVYRVVVRVFEDGKMLQGKDELEKIARKFYDWGYKAPLEITNDDPDSAVLTLIATEEELKSFTPDEEHGYFFFLFHEPDAKLTTDNGENEE